MISLAKSSYFPPFCFKKKIRKASSRDNIGSQQISEQASFVCPTESGSPNTPRDFLQHTGKQTFYTQHQGTLPDKIILQTQQITPAQQLLFYVSDTNTTSEQTSRTYTTITIALFVSCRSIQCFVQHHSTHTNKRKKRTRTRKNDTFDRCLHHSDRILLLIWTHHESVCHGFRKSTASNLSNLLSIWWACLGPKVLDAKYKVLSKWQNTIVKRAQLARTTVVYTCETFSTLSCFMFFRTFLAVVSG